MLHAPSSHGGSSDRWKVTCSTLYLAHDDMATLPLELGSPQAAAVQNAVQRVLVAHDMASADDVVMAEYVTVMIANHKGPDAIGDELRDLVGSDMDAAVPQEIWQAALAVFAPAEAERPPQRRSASPRRRDRSASPRRLRTTTTDRPEGGRDAADRWEDKRSGHRASPRRGKRDVELFPERKNRSAMRSDTIEEPSLSIFGRAGVPDPHAPPFVPNAYANMPPPPMAAMAAMAAMAGAPSLFARLDPMMPDNPAPDAAAAAAAQAQSNVPRDAASFPTRPAQSALCRFGVQCTNPLCGFSHPSPANAGRDGDASALVLREDACERGAACDDKECVLSHVSPSVAFRKARSTEPCRFQQQCLNPTCAYAHYDAQGRVMQPGAAAQSQGPAPREPCRYGAGCTRPDCFYTHPASTRSAVPCRYGDGCTRPDCYFRHPRDGPARPTSERLAKFAEEDPDRERIVPGAA